MRDLVVTCASRPFQNTEGPTVAKMITEDKLGIVVLSRQEVNDIKSVVYQNRAWSEICTILTFYIEPHSVTCRHVHLRQFSGSTWKRVAIRRWLLWRWSERSIEVYAFFHHGSLETPHTLIWVGTLKQKVIKYWSDGAVLCRHGEWRRWTELGEWQHVDVDTLLPLVSVFFPAVVRLNWTFLSGVLHQSFALTSPAKKICVAIKPWWNKNLFFFSRLWCELLQDWRLPVTHVCKSVNLQQFKGNLSNSIRKHWRKKK